MRRGFPVRRSGLHRRSVRGLVRRRASGPIWLLRQEGPGHPPNERSMPWCGSDSGHPPMSAGLLATHPDHGTSTGDGLQSDQVICALRTELPEGPPRLENLALMPPDLGYRSAPSTPMTYTVVGRAKQICVITLAHRNYVPRHRRPVTDVLSAGLAMNCTPRHLRISGRPSDSGSGGLPGTTSNGRGGLGTARAPGPMRSPLRPATEQATTSERVD